MTTEGFDKYCRHAKRLASRIVTLHLAPCSVLGKFRHFNFEPDIKTVERYWLAANAAHCLRFKMHASLPSSLPALGGVEGAKTLAAGLCLADSASNCAAANLDRQTTRKMQYHCQFQ